MCGWWREPHKTCLMQPNKLRLPHLPREVCDTIGLRTVDSFIQKQAVKVDEMTADWVTGKTITLHTSVHPTGLSHPSESSTRCGSGGTDCYLIHAEGWRLRWRWRTRHACRHDSQVTFDIVGAIAGSLTAVRPRRLGANQVLSRDRYLPHARNEQPLLPSPPEPSHRSLAYRLRGWPMT